MERINIGKFVKMVELTPTTLRRMHETGELVPCHISKGGIRDDSTGQLDKFLGHTKSEKKAMGYCRVSTPAQREDLRKQVENVRTYRYAKGYPFEIMEEKINNHEILK